MTAVTAPAVATACCAAPLTLLPRDRDHRCRGCGHRRAPDGTSNRIRQTRYQPSLWLTEHARRRAARR